MRMFTLVVVASVLSLPARAATRTAIDATFFGTATSLFFGFDVTNAGDVNGDGYADLLISDPYDSSAVGQVSLYLGGVGTPSTTAAVSLTGGVANDYFGYAVGGGGDVNGDGYDDVVIGAYYRDSHVGGVDVCYGSSAGLSMVDCTSLSGLTSNSLMGWSVDIAGDVNGDGYADVIVGAPGLNYSTGAASLYLGGPAGVDTSASETWTGSANYRLMGYHVSGAGDFNGDGFDDVLLSEPGSGSSTPTLYLAFGSATGISSTSSTTYTVGVGYGNMFSGIGDVNGDGYDDVAVGAANAGSTFQGDAYIYMGNATGLSSLPDQIYHGGTAEGSFGCGVAGGDVNLDGYSDLIVGAMGENTWSGQAYVYLGASTGLSTVAVTVLVGPTGSIYYGRSITIADLDGDGAGDAIVGAANTAPSGLVYFYHWPQDLDADGFLDTDDCDDSDAGIYPGATEIPGDGVDQDCDGADGVAGDTGDTADTDDTADTADTGDSAEEADTADTAGGDDSGGTGGADGSGGSGGTGGTGSDNAGGGSDTAADSLTDKDGGGCGCATTGGDGAGALMLFGLAVLGLRRRR